MSSFRLFGVRKWSMGTCLHEFVSCSNLLFDVFELDDICCGHHLSKRVWWNERTLVIV